VANHISDTVSVVNVSAGAVTFAIEVPDEPCDVVTAGPAGRAFVTCQQENKIAVINYLGGQLTEILTVDAENPRALAVSADRTKVYAAVFESGNRTTILAGGADDLSVVPFPNSIVSEPAGPHGGQNPPPNDGPVFFPLKNPGNGAPPAVGLIVKETPEGWVDDTGANWDAFVSGPMAGLSGRPQGWQLLDHDIVVIDAANLSVSYVDSLMNINMAIAVHPQTGMVNVVGTEAINHIRFEPVVNGIFARVMMATASNTTRTGLVDLNADHLAEAQSQLPGGGDDPYARPRVPPAARARSIGDPRGIAWNSTGTLAFITGMGSNNMIVVNADGQRVHPDIPLREGPTGVVVDDMRGQVYALNRFHGSISVVSTQSFTETANVRFYDPTPEVIRRGRRHLYDTHKTSGLGHVSCATCHVDARFDRLAWDLGDPAGQVKDVLDIGFGGDLNLGANIPLMDPLDFDNFHPMKGPMTTQTLIGIIGHEPHHWRGDRLGLEEFNPAFMGLLGDDAQLTPQEMQEFEDFLATIHFPPNPYRNLDNSLPDNLPLEGHYATGDNNLPEGTPLPNGNAVNGLFLYRGAPGLSGIPTRQLDQQAFTCVICHTLPSGDGTNARYNGAGWTPIPRDPLTNAAHVAMVSIDGSTNRAIKVPHLQPVYEKTGFSMVNRNGDKTSLSGFGYLHDGSIDSIERFFAAGGPNGAHSAFRMIRKWPTWWPSCSVFRAMTLWRRPRSSRSLIPRATTRRMYTPRWAHR
jgi:DNA-binding beta-propeller fold protein YncE